MTIRTGQMDVRVLSNDDHVGSLELQRVAAAVNAELAKTGERLIRLLGDHWTGYLDGMGPYMVYSSVAFEAETTS